MTKIAIDIGNLNTNRLNGIVNHTLNLIDNVIKKNENYKFILIRFSPLKNQNLSSYISFKKKFKILTFKIPSKLFLHFFIIWQKIGFPPVEWLTGKIDIFHSFDWYCPPVNKAKLIANVHDVIPIIYPEWCTRGNVIQHTNRLNSIKKRADIIITDSLCSKRDIVKSLGINEEKVIVAYPGIDTKKFRQINDKKKINKIFKKYKIQSGYILFIGTLQPRKNILRLIKAFSLLRDKEIKLVLAGKRGNQFENYQFPKNVIWLNYVKDEDLPYLYNGASVFVYPSLYEGFGLPILEAMACGCPVVTSDISSMPEVAGNAAILVDPNSIKSIKEGIEKILNNPKLKSKCIEKGFNRVKCFTWEKCAQIIKDQYKKLTDENCSLS